MLGKRVFTIQGGVLILVLMEDALVHGVDRLCRANNRSLNPCFNGRCTRTSEGLICFRAQRESLNPCFNGRCTRTALMIAIYVSRHVLILVLMEDALVHLFC